VKLNLRQTANAKRRESTMRFQVGELALDSGTATVEVTPPLSVAGDARKEPAANGDREDRLLPLDAAKRDDRFAETKPAVPKSVDKSGGLCGIAAAFPSGR
jgi:hypothetical protein